MLRCGKCRGRRLDELFVEYDDLKRFLPKVESRLGPNPRSVAGPERRSLVRKDGAQFSPETLSRLKGSTREIQERYIAKPTARTTLAPQIRRETVIRDPIVSGRSVVALWRWWCHPHCGAAYACRNERLLDALELGYRRGHKALVAGIDI